MSYFLDPNARRTVQYNEHPTNTPLKGRFPGWKYYREGVIMEHRLFYYTDSRGKQTYRQTSPGFEVLDETTTPQ